MSKYCLYDIFADKWLKDCDSIWIYSDPHFSDIDSYKLRFPKECDTESADGCEHCSGSAINCPKYDLDEKMVSLLDEMQIKNINSKCGKNSCLIILGDVGNVECVKKLKAKYKILIMGNHDKGASNYKKEVYHDTKFIDEFPLDFIPEEHGYRVVDPTPVGNLYDKVTTNNLFDEVYEGPLMVNDRLILSHEPIEGLPKYMFNVHGHNHTNKFISYKHLNVCAEIIDYTPINLTKLLKKGLLKNTDSIHRQTIDIATLRKLKKGSEGDWQK